MSSNLVDFAEKKAKRISLTLGFSNSSRSLHIGRPVFYAGLIVLPALAIWYLFATVYLIFRDDMLASLMNRQTAMQYAYEDRITTLHTQIDQLTHRRLLDEASLKSKMEDIASRQARLERRSSVVADLADRVLPKTGADMSIARKSLATGTPAPNLNPLLNGAYSVNNAPLPGSVSAFAPGGFPAAAPQRPTPLPSAEASAKPQPEGFDLRPSKDLDFDSAPLPEKAAGQSSSLRSFESEEEQVAQMTASLDRIEKTQNLFIAQLQTPLLGEVTRVRTVIADAGLSADRFKRSISQWDMKKGSSDAQGTPVRNAVGGPFVPVRLEADGSAFEREANLLQKAILEAEHWRNVLSTMPLRKPVLGELEITSGFGARTDPFYGRAAMHTGVDLRDDMGTDIYATAGGKVITAGPEGGYGNMVEIDHGNGLTTRYAHMGQIAVTEGKIVKAGDIIGHVGMTGRTTGPHLHYEVRIDGEPVDPMRFLRLGERLFATKTRPNLIADKAL